MTLTVGKVKGGVGKMTLAFNNAINRALAGRDVLLVDGDEQGTTAAFTHDQRPSPITCVDARKRIKKGTRSPHHALCNSARPLARAAAEWHHHHQIEG